MASGGFIASVESAKSTDCDIPASRLTTSGSESQVKVQDDPVVEGSAAALARPRIGGDGNPPPGPVAVWMRPLSDR
jgi:hypothetical protein